MTEGMSNAGGRAGRLAVGLFLLCQTCAYVDRQVISLLVAPLKAEMGLSDLQIGLLQGFAFALCYAVMGIPIAWLLDRGDRVGIASTCVALWSCATAACAFAGNFASLVLARMATAVAEAGLPPAALSIISDTYPSHRLSRATATYMLGPYLGTAIALVVGGQLLQLFDARGGLDVPLLGHLTPWRAVFLIVASPGLILALAVRLLLRDPRRSAAVRPDDGGDRVTLGGTVVAQRGFLLRYCFGAALALLVTFSQTAWLPTLLMRVHGLSPAEAGGLIGPAYLLAGIAGSIVAAFATGRNRADPLDRILRVMALAAAGLVGASLATGIAPTTPLVVAAFAASAFCSGIIVVLSAVPLQLTAPAPVRARIITIGALVISITGAGGGPFLVGAVTDLIFVDPLKVGQSLAIVTGVSALLGSWALHATRRHAPPITVTDDRLTIVSNQEEAL